MALANLSIHYTWKGIKTEYNNNKFKISAPTWNETFDLTDGSYSIDDIQYYFEFIIKKHETLTENPQVNQKKKQKKNQKKNQKKYTFHQKKDNKLLMILNYFK